MWFATPLRKLHGGFPTFCKVGRVIFAIRYRLTQEWGYEPDEYSQLMVLLDERPLPGGAVDYFARIEGDGDTGAARSTGWSTFSLNASRRMSPRVHVGSEAASVRLCYARDT